MLYFKKLFLKSPLPRNLILSYFKTESLLKLFFLFPQPVPSPYFFPPAKHRQRTEASKPSQNQRTKSRSLRRSSEPRAANQNVEAANQKQEPQQTRSIEPPATGSSGFSGFDRFTPV